LFPVVTFLHIPSTTRNVPEYPNREENPDKVIYVFYYIKGKKWFTFKFFHIKHSYIVDKAPHNFTL
jgi:hypothetical protein